MRPIWKGHLTFGLVTIPVKLYTATEGKDVRFRLLHSSCMTPIQNKRYCPQHEQIVDWNDVVRGYEYAKGKFVPVSDEELDGVPLDTAGTVNVTSFADLQEIDPIYYEKSYYLAPDEGGQKAFRLLHDTMDETTKVAVGKAVVGVPVRKPEKVVDLMDALRRSLQMTRKEKLPGRRPRALRPASGQGSSPRAAAMRERHR